MSKSYRVQGMTCGGCVNSVTKAVQAVVGDAKVEVSLEAGTVTIDGFEEAAPIGRAIEDAGFEFGGPA